MSLGQYFIPMMFYIVTGGLCIACAIDDYKKNHYIRCGFWTMTAISMILSMARFIFIN
jgi:hypothetical protein